ncbi:hydrogenase expression/formation protein HypE [Neolewinella lacunae]|uniref:Hydrogenase expression/formation protein HypE n=1 Tax=Neolewinella lacunae TaxID=1517758 RepID=A0A923PNV1_9BACT|nr:hydrogenase expression/formation protein HypE [Neolewinella lacunae]MBC6995101.1 hydrogenase expression/formation protein HypE [Neolewinella lacunae]MDN3634051.1 hydrogenase expression/formation protein HypE [Neolewinella lacunae]
MPKLDFDTINLGHGSGGKLTNQLLDSGVFSVLKNDLLDQRHDGAILELSGKTAFTTDSFVISPVFFPGGDIGELAVNGTVNDLAMCGAIPRYLSLAFILEEGLPMTEFWDILVSIRNACAAAGVSVVTGDTKVVERGKGDKVFVNTTGVGTVHPKAEIDIRRIMPGDKIIVSGQLAAHGMAIMSVREGLEFESQIVSDTQPLNHLVKDLLDEFGNNIKLLRDPTRGGVGTALNEMARDRDLGVHLEQRALPIDPQVAGACELLGLDPLYVANEGLFLAVVSGAAAGAMVGAMQRTDTGRHARIIGEFTDQHPKKVVMTSGIGGQRIVNMLIGEQLPRIC